MTILEALIFMWIVSAVVQGYMNSRAYGSPFIVEFLQALLFLRRM